MAIRMPLYGLPLSQSDQRISLVFQSVHNDYVYMLATPLGDLATVIETKENTV